MKDSKNIPEEILSSPSLLYLYWRIERIFGITAGFDALVNLNVKLEKKIKSSFTENPAAFERMLSSEDQNFKISKYFTVNETYFFREEAHFNLLESLLPELIKLNRKISICSAACSLGCEAYSIAMFLDYQRKNNNFDFDFIIDAFDVNKDSIEKAKQAVYSANSLRSDGSSFNNILDLYLLREKNDLLVTQHIRNKVNFFTFNIMKRFEQQYDIIFFRNALIYFSPESRLLVINNLAEALNKDGILITGTSETSSVKHPFLESKNHNDIFYFQKSQNSIADIIRSINIPVTTNQKSPLPLPSIVPSQSIIPVKEKETKKQKELTIECNKITENLELLETEEIKYINTFMAKIVDENENAGSITGSELAAFILYLLSCQKFYTAEIALSYLEKYNSCAFTLFLRGEFNFLQDTIDPLKYFQAAAVKNKYFWPAFYRIAGLASIENEDKIRYEYKIKKAIESIELGKDYGYECFLGGFSPDYFRRILEKKINGI